MTFSASFKICLTCCLLLFVASCRKTDSSGSGGTLPVNPIPATTDPRGELTKSMSAVLAAKSYRAHWVSSSDSGINSTMVMEFVAPDRYHILREADVRGRASKNETIIVGQDTYMKMGDSPWQKFPVNVGEVIAQFRDPKVIDELSKDAEIKFIGPDTVDGMPAMVYQYILNDPQRKGFKNTSKTWVGVVNNLPLKTESEGEVEMMGKTVKSKSTMTYSDFGAEIKIERPI